MSNLVHDCKALRQIFRSRAVSKAVEIKIYKTMVKPAVVFGSETRAMAEMDMTRLGMWDRIILTHSLPVI